MKSGTYWLNWLVWAAGADWLLARTLARSAIFMPKSPAVLGVYQALTTLGQVAGVLSALLALLAVLRLAWSRRRRARGLISLGLAGLAGLSSLFLFAPSAGWMHLLYQALFLGVIAVQGWQAFASYENKDLRMAFLFPWAALCTGGLYQVVQALYTAAHWPGPPRFTFQLFNAGELFAVLTPIALWWVVGRKARRAFYLWALLPAVGFTGLYLSVSSMAGILAIWSTGLSLYLPWPLYAAAIWLAGVTLLACRKEGNPAGAALFLLAAGGYTPGLSSQAFLGLLALDLLDAKSPNRANIRNHSQRFGWKFWRSAAGRA